MPYRALIITLVTVSIALLAIGMWARSISPMFQEVVASTQPASRPGVALPEAVVASAPAATLPVTPDRQFKRVVKGTMLLAFVLICMLFVVGFFASFREWVRVTTLSQKRTVKKTVIVDAWKLAGQRMKTPEPGEGDDLPGDSDKLG